MKITLCDNSRPEICWRSCFRKMKWYWQSEQGKCSIQCQIFQRGEGTELGQAYGPWTCSQLCSVEKGEYLYLSCALSSTKLTCPHVWQLATLFLRHNLHTLFTSKLSLSISRHLFYASCIFCCPTECQRKVGGWLERRKGMGRVSYSGKWNFTRAVPHRLILCPVGSSNQQFTACDGEQPVSLGLCPCWKLAGGDWENPL